MSIKKRLDLIVKELGLTGRAFEREVGLANGSYSSIGEGVGAEKLNKIFDRYPQLSADWLVRGLGNMLRTGEKLTELDGRNNDLGSVFAETAVDIPEHSLNQGVAGEMKTVLYQLAALVSAQQQDISRLIAELERNGKRTDQLMTIVDRQNNERDEGAFPNTFSSPNGNIRI